MPFGIFSVTEVFQRDMHVLIEGLHGTEVIAGDFIVAGFGDTRDEVTSDHDKNLDAFLLWCEDRRRLNMDKVQLRKQVAFIGNVATVQGLCVDPHKVRAESEMLPHKNVVAIQHLLGLTQNLSNSCQPLRYHKTTERVYPEWLRMDLGPGSIKHTGYAEKSCH